MLLLLLPAAKGCATSGDEGGDGRSVVDAGGEGVDASALLFMVRDVGECKGECVATDAAVAAASAAAAARGVPIGARGPRMPLRRYRTTTGEAGDSTGARREGERTLGEDELGVAEEPEATWPAGVQAPLLAFVTRQLVGLARPVARLLVTPPRGKARPVPTAGVSA